MRNIEILEILEVLDRNNYASSERLADKLAIGGKTLRGRIGQINEVLPKSFAAIEMKRGVGYLLRVKDEQGFLDWKTRLLEEEKKEVPCTTEERVNYLLLYFLCHREYIKKAELCELLFVSEKTISQELRKTEKVLRQYGIQIEKKAHYGMRSDGDEFAKRQCLMNFYTSGVLSDDSRDEAEQKRRIRNVVLEVVREEQLLFSEMSVHCLIDYIYVSICRIRHGFVIEDAKIRDIDAKLVDAAKQVINKLWKMEFAHADREQEAVYLAVYLQGSRMYKSDLNGTSNLIITEDVIHLVDEMLESIYEVYLVDMRNAFNLRMNLYKHLVCMELRLQYGIEIKNPLLMEIKETYLFSYLLAQQACIFIAEKYNRNISDDEIAYLAMLFELQKSQDEESVTVEKKKILLVCATGRTSSEFLMLTLMKKFGKDIEKIDLCSAYELEEWNLGGYDGIFTTIPIARSVSIPVILIHDFLSQSELEQVREEFMDEDEWRVLEQFYKSKFFFTGITGSTKEEVLTELCRRTGEAYPLTEQFLPSVLCRGNLGGTDFGNLTAIPHPYERMLKENLVSVGILERPIQWTTNQVQLVILTAISQAVDEDVRRYFDITLKVISSEEMVNEILREQDFDTLCRVLKKVIHQKHE